MSAQNDSKNVPQTTEELDKNIEANLTRKLRSSGLGELLIQEIGLVSKDPKMPYKAVPKMIGFTPCLLFTTYEKGVKPIGYINLNTLKTTEKSHDLIRGYVMSDSLKTRFKNEVYSAPLCE